MVTGQAVDTFDRLFQLLYTSSSYVGLRHVATQPEPEPEPLPQPAAVIPPSAAIARKLYNPKYALVAASSPSPTPTPSAGDNSPTENSSTPDVPGTNKRRKKQISKEAIQDVPPIHPGLTDLEKVCLFDYLPTWPEPDPPSDVIGFINIRDASRPNQVHLQRSEMFETSQAIRFSSPISVPKEALPEVAKPRHLPAPHKEMGKPQPVQNTQRDTEPGVSKPKLEAPEQKMLISGQKSQPSKVLSCGNKLQLNTSSSRDTGCNTSPHFDAHTPLLSSSQASTPNTQGPSHSPKPDLLDTNSETGFNTQSVVRRIDTVESTGTQSQDLHAPSDSNKNPELGLPLNNSHTLNMQPQNSSETAANIQSHTENNQVPTNTTTTADACSALSPILSSVIPPLTSPAAPPTPLSSSVSSSTPTPTPTPPVPKPRTVQLIIRDGGTSDAQNLPEISVVRRTGSPDGASPLVVHSKPDGANEVQTLKAKVEETLPELHNSKPGGEKDTENTRNPKEAPQQQQQQQQSTASRETAVGLHDNRAETQTQPEVLIPDTPKSHSVNTQEVEPKYLAECKFASKTQPDQTDPTAPEEALTSCEFSPQKYSCETIPHNSDGLQTVNSVEASTQLPVSSTTNSHISKDGADGSRDGQRGKPSTASALCTGSEPDVAKHNSLSQELQQTPKPRGNSHTPERPLFLHLSETHVRDLRSPTPERELTSRTPTPDSRTHTPDFQILTPDVSDECVSPRDDSNHSTASEEYYECSDSPCHDPVFDGVGNYIHGITENHVSFAHTNTLNGTAERNNASSETQSLSVKVSNSPLLDAPNEENGRGEGRKQTVADRRTEQESQGSEKRGSEEAKKTADRLKEGLTEIVKKGSESQPQIPKRKGALNKSAAETAVDGRVTLRKSTSEGTDSKQLSAEGLKPDNVSSEAERPEKVMRPSGVDKRDDGQKV